MKNKKTDLQFGQHNTDKFLASAIFVAILIIAMSCAVGFGWLQG